MAKQIQVSKRRQEAEARRRKVMSSVAFQTWWAARQNIHPVPADPYRAFMIDISLHARVHRREIWEHRTPRADYPSVDLPSWLPAPKRRLPSRKEERRFKVIPRAAEPFQVTPFEVGLKQIGEKMAEKYHVPMPRIFFERREGAIESAYFHGLAGIMEPFIKIGTKGQERMKSKGQEIETSGIGSQIFGIFEHEFGHHAHARFGLEPSMAAAGKISLEFASATKIEREKKAWELADPFMVQRRPIQKWVKRYGLGTYLGIIPRGQRQVLQITGIGVEKRRR